MAELKDLHKWLVTEPTPKQETAREVLAELLGAARQAGITTGTPLAPLFRKADALLASLDAQTSGGDTRPHDDDLDLADVAFRVGAERMRDLCAETVLWRVRLLLGNGVEANRNAQVLRYAVLAIPLPGSAEEQARTLVGIDELTDGEAEALAQQADQTARDKAETGA